MDEQGVVLQCPESHEQLFSEYRIRGQKLPRRRGAGASGTNEKDLPSEVFTQIYQPPVSKGDGYDRDNLLKADKLLNEAGWVLKGQQRVNATTGQPLSFELLLPASSNSRGYCRSSTACNGWVSTWTFARWITRKSPTACAVATMT